jgi:hypothetical protein
MPSGRELRVNTVLIRTSPFLNPMAGKEERHNLPDPGGGRPTTKKATRGRPSSRGRAGGGSTTSTSTSIIKILYSIDVDVFASR